MKSEPLNDRNVRAKFAKRVNAAARAIGAVAKTRSWIAEHKLPADVVTKGLTYLETAIEAAKRPTGGSGGFQA